MTETAAIMVTGSTGQLGSELKDIQAQFSNYRFHFFSRNELSITDEEAVTNAFKSVRPSFLINCAAYTAVDLAEVERENAISINADAVGILASICKQHNTCFLHLSTDYVFDGKNSRPWKETDDVNPVSFYGETKLAGERLAMQNNGDSLIIRTSWVYSQYGKNFVKTMLRLMEEKQSINVVNDQIGSPTYAADLAQAILQIIDSKKWVGGIYHFSNDGAISWYDFAQEIKKSIGSKCTINSISTSQFPTPAKRPAYSVLDNSKIKQVYGVKSKDWRQSLDACIQKLT